MCYYFLARCNLNNTPTHSPTTLKAKTQRPASSRGTLRGGLTKNPASQFLAKQGTNTYEKRIR